MYLPSTKKPCCASCARGGKCAGDLGATQEQKDTARGAFGFFAILLIGMGLAYYATK